MADTLTDACLIFPGQRQHLIVRIDADNLALRANNLRGDVADLAGARTQIEDDIAFADKCRRVSASIVALFDFIRYDAEVLLVILDRTTKARLATMSRPAVSFVDGVFHINGCTHSLILAVITYTATCSQRHASQTTPATKRQHTSSRSKAHIQLGADPFDDPTA